MCNNYIRPMGFLRELSFSYLFIIFDRAEQVDTLLIFAMSASQNGIPSDQSYLFSSEDQRSRGHAGAAKLL